MSDLFIPNGRAGSDAGFEDPLMQAVKSFKEATRSAMQDLNIGFFQKTLSSVNEASPLKVARNPIDKDGRWRRGTVLRNVKSIEIDDSGRLLVRTRGDNTEYPVEKALDQMQRLHRKLQRDNPLVLAISETERVQITDVYSHAFVQNAWAGLPFDLVLAYFEEEPEEN